MVAVERERKSGGAFVFPWPDQALLAAMKTPEGVDPATEELKFQGFKCAEKPDESSD